MSTCDYSEEAIGLVQGKSSCILVDQRVKPREKQVTDEVP